MDKIIKEIWENKNWIAKTVLNLGGTLLVGYGIWLLPFDQSYKLIVLGIFVLVMWYSYDFN